MPVETRESIIASFPELPEGPEPDDIASGEPSSAEESDTPAESNDKATPEVEVETPPAEAEAPKTETETAKPDADPELETLKADAELARSLRSHLESLPPEQRQAALEALGLAEPQPAETPAEDSQFYSLAELIGPQGEALAALPASVDARFNEFDQGLRQVFAAQSSVIDQTAVESRINSEILKHLAEQFQLEIPVVDPKAILEGLKAGKDLGSLVTDALKPTFEKNAARTKQAREARPDTPGDTANDIEGLPDKASMSDILAARRGLRVG